jgi:hypothetical protein
MYKRPSELLQNRKPHRNAVSTIQITAGSHERTASSRARKPRDPPKDGLCRGEFLAGSGKSVNREHAPRVGATGPRRGTACFVRVRGSRAFLNRAAAGGQRWPWPAISRLRPCIERDQSYRSAPVPSQLPVGQATCCHPQAFQARPSEPPHDRAGGYGFSPVRDARSHRTQPTRLRHDRVCMSHFARPATPRSSPACANFRARPLSRRCPPDQDRVQRFQSSRRYGRLRASSGKAGNHRKNRLRLRIVGLGLNRSGTTGRNRARRLLRSAAWNYSCDESTKAGVTHQDPIQTIS